MEVQFLALLLTPHVTLGTLLGPINVYIRVWQSQHFLFSGSVSHQLALQSFCGRIHPSVRKMLRVSYWRAPQMSTSVLPLLGV